jgi:hypothetical protein
MQRACVIAILMCLTAVTATPQSQGSDFQPATIVAVKPDASNDGDTNRYDVTLRVGKMEYVVLYSPPSGAKRAEYAAGQDLLCKVGTKSIGVRDMLGRYSEWPILSSRTIAEEVRR